MKTPIKLLLPVWWCNTLEFQNITAIFFLKGCKDYNVILKKYKSL